MADIDEEALSRQGTTNDDENAQGRPSGRSEKAMLRTKVVFFMLTMPSIIVLVMVYAIGSDNTRGATEFSMHLAGYEGLNATTLGHTVSSPAFSLKLRVENPRVALQPWCYSGGQVTVSYSDVALAWGGVPRFCVKIGAPVEVTAVALGREVSLPEDLRGRLASDRHMGTAKIMVNMKLFYEDLELISREYSGPSLQPFQLIL